MNRPARRNGRLLRSATGVLAAALVAPLTASLTAVAAAPNATPAATNVDGREALGRLPIRFEPNQGQTADPVDFVARVGGSVVFVTPKGAVLSVERPKMETDEEGRSVAAADGSTVREAVFMNLVGAKSKPKVEGLDKLPGTSNYLAGSAESLTDVPGYGRVRYKDVYPGIDMVYRGGADGLAYDFEVDPGADPGRIALEFKGAAGLSVSPDGNLRLDAQNGALHQSKPVTFQDTGNGRHTVDSGFVSDGTDRVRFHVGGYDRSKKLVIDPTLAWSSFLGGSSSGITEIAVDGSGVYVAGNTSSPTFPTTPGVVQTGRAGSTDAFVTKLSPTGTSLVYSTYLGGASGDDSATGLAVDGSGRAYLTGTTGSVDFPTTPGVLSTNRSRTDGITVLNSDIYRTAAAAFGPADVGKAIFSPNIGVVTITSLLSPFSVRVSSRANASGTGLHFTIGPASGLGFVSRLSANGSSLEFSTYFGGSGTSPGSIAVDGSGSTYVVGGTSSADFTTTSGAFDANRTFTDGVATFSSTTYTSASASFSSADLNRVITGANLPPGTTIASVTDASTVELSASAIGSGSGLTFTLGSHSGGGGFLSRLSADGTSLLYSTYLAGTGGGDSSGVILVGGQPVVVGSSGSGDFPVQAGAYQATNAGGSDVTVSKLDITVVGDGTGVVSPSNSALVFSTFIGGSGNDSGRAVAADGSGAVYVTGTTESTDFPTTPGASDTTCSCSGKAFVTKLAANGSSVAYSTYLGGSGGDGGITGGSALYVDGSGAAHVAGGTSSSDFPTVSPLEFSAGGDDGFLTTLDPSGTSLSFSTYLGGSGSDSILAVASDGVGGTYVAGGTGSADLPTTQAAFDQTFNGTAGFVAHIGAGASPPALKTLDPPGGPTSGGTTVVITGAGFTGATNVAFGGTPASFTVDSDTQITAITPGGGDSASVEVTGPNGTNLFPLYYVFGRGIFQATGSCATICGMLSVTLENGKILAMTPGASGTANVYDPLTGTWSATGVCTTCAANIFNDAPLVLLTGGAGVCGTNCGKVLYTGGKTGGSNTSPSAITAFLYDPTAGTWSATTSMNFSHLGHSATRLPNGKVLVAGGCAQNRNCGPSSGTGNNASVKAEIFDPLLATWTATSDLAAARSHHTAVVLDSAVGNCGTDCGKVLVAGGNNNGGTIKLDSEELFDPAAGTWLTLPPMREQRYFHRAVLLKTGKVLEVGGYLAVDTSDEYRSFNRTLMNPLSRMAFAAGLGALLSPLPSGQALSVGGTNAQLFSPSSFATQPGSWGRVASPRLSHANGISASMPSGPLSVCGTNCGKVLVAGGDFGTAAELYTPEPAIDPFNPPTPNSGPGNGGTTVTVTGTGLAAVNRVTFGGLEGTNIVHDPVSPDTSLTVVSPAHGAGGVSIVAYSDGGQTNESFNYTSDPTGPAVADFDGDFDTDIAVFRPSQGAWYVKDGVSAVWGMSGDIPVPGDYDGDFDTDIAIFRPSESAWYVKDGVSAVWGMSGDIPVPGDYDGDGRTDMAVFRPSDGSWHVKDGVTEMWGMSGDIPVPGDYDGDGRTDIAVFRPSEGAWYVKDGPSAVWGNIAGDIPVPGDYDGNGSTDIAVFRSSTGAWFVRDGASAAWGVTGDVPSPGDYNGDGLTEFAVFRPGVSAAWYVTDGLNESSAPFGTTGDVPLPLPNAIYRFFF